MSSPEVASNHVTELLNQWYLQIEQDHLEEGKHTKEKIEKLLKGMAEDRNILQYYSLLDQRQQARIKEKAAETKDNQADKQMSYYFYLYKGLNAYKINAYNEALESYRQAEEYLAYISDQLEQADFYYKVAALYYQLYKTELSIEKARKALEIYREDPKSAKKTAGCYIILALNSITIQKFSYAEDCLALAWYTAVYENDWQLQYMICHNLGLLYKEKGDLQTSIKWLLESMKYSEPVHQTYYLLAESACNLKQLNNARNWIESGLNICKSNGHIEYLHRFLILKVKYGEYQPDIVEKVLRAAIDFFIEEETWLHVKDHVHYLIELYKKMGKVEEAKKYEEWASVAEEKLSDPTLQ